MASVRAKMNQTAIKIKVYAQKKNHVCCHCPSQNSKPVKLIHDDLNFNLCEKTFRFIFVYISSLKSKMNSYHKYRGDLPAV